MENYLRNLRKINDFVKAYVGDTYIYIVSKNKKGRSMLDEQLRIYFTLAVREQVLKNIVVLDVKEEKDKIEEIDTNIDDFVLFYK